MRHPRTGETMRVRPLEPCDVEPIVRYWTDADDADLLRMGVDIPKLRALDVRAGLEACLRTGHDLPRVFYLVWDLADRGIGFSTLKNVAVGHRGEIHLHMWDASLHGRGYGAYFFCLAALDFYDRFQLREIVCEPSAGNPMPNGMLRRAGFTLAGTRFGRSSDLSAETRLNTWLIDRATAARLVTA